MPTYCQEIDCKKQSSYNYKGEKRKLYCAEHKKDGMTNVMDKKCIYDKCEKISVFNYNGETSGLYCATHKKDNMIDVITKRCLEDGCNTHPIYNYQGKKRGIYCAIHRKEYMVNVKDKKCLENMCKIIPVYNYEGESSGLYCTTHKKDGMINVLSKKCLENRCNKQPSYNYEGEKEALYCITHKKEDMIDIKSKTCLEDMCKIKPIYNYKEEVQGLYCNKHKKDGMINVIHKRCLVNMCQIIPSNPKYKGYCLNCFIHLFPDEPNTRNYKTKEKATTDYILQKYPNFSWVTDKRIQDGCSNKRPDLLLDLGYQVIIVEIDENQHQTYDCSCENKRLMLLSQDVGHRSIVFIRFNPDEYNTKDRKVTSCWSLNGHGICTVKKTKQKEWTQRLEALKNQIEYWIQPENKTEKTVEIIQLFYDCD